MPWESKAYSEACISECPSVNDITVSETEDPPKSTSLPEAFQDYGEMMSSVPSTNVNWLDLLRIILTAVLRDGNVLSEPSSSPSGALIN